MAVRCQCTLQSGSIIAQVGLDAACMRLLRNSKAAACVARRASSNQQYMVPQEACSVGGFTEFTRPLKNAPRNVERLLKQFGVGHAERTAPQLPCSWSKQVDPRVDYESTN
jgi:hypothetical protein